MCQGGHQPCRKSYGSLSLMASLSSFLACNSRLCIIVRWPHPPQRPVLGHIHCFRQCEIVGSQILMYGAQPCDAGASSRSPPVLWRKSWQDPLGICVVVHMCNMPKNGSGDVTGLLQWVWVVPLASGPRRFEQIGAIWYLAAFVDTTDHKHRSSVHLSSRLPSSLTHIGR